MIVVGRHINGIFLNPLEYIVDIDGEMIGFESELEAKVFLIGTIGMTEDDMYYLVFKEIDDE